jgi:RNA polymerase sigma factor (sigma-70 family)
MRRWLFTIVANECKRRQRTRWWSRTTLPETLEDRAGDPTADAESADLRRAIYRLPYEQRLVVAMRYYVDLSFEEIAQTLGVSTNAVKQRTYRALKRLRLSPEVLGDE